MTIPVTIRLQQADFDIAREIAALSRGRTDIGAVVSFSGICALAARVATRIAALTLEHYPGMAEAEIARHAEEALSRWPLTGSPSSIAMAASCRAKISFWWSRRRRTAKRRFRRAEFLMDYLKTQCAVLEARRGRGWVEAGSMPTITTMPPRRAGPNPDGEDCREWRTIERRGLRLRSKRPSTRAAEKQQTRRVANFGSGTLLDFRALRFVSRCHRGASSFSRTAPPIRWPRPRFWFAKRCICIRTSSRPFATRARHRAAEACKLLDLIERRVATAKARRLSGQQDLHARACRSMSTSA